MNKKTPVASKKSKPQRAQRAPNLDDARILKIVQLLDGWVGPLTWDLFTDSIEKNVGGRYVRQTLDRHVRIKEAYQQAKSRRNGDETEKKSDQMTAKELRRKAADYDRLKNEVERLERENNNYAKQFARWVWNLRQMKITEDQINKLDHEMS